MLVRSSCVVMFVAGSDSIDSFFLSQARGWWPRGQISSFWVLSHRMHSLIGFRKSTPPQYRQLVVYYYLSKCSVDGVVGELTFWNWLIKPWCQIQSVLKLHYGKVFWLIFEFGVQDFIRLCIRTVDYEPFIQSQLSQKCAAVPMRALFKAHRLHVSLNSRGLRVTREEGENTFPGAINSKALCGATTVALHADIRGKEPSHSPVWSRE